MLVGRAQSQYDSSKTVLDSIKTMTDKIGTSLVNSKEKFFVSKKRIGISVREVPTDRDIYVIAGITNDTSYTRFSYQKPDNISREEGIVQSIMRVPSEAFNLRQQSYISSINYQNSGLFLTMNELDYILYEKKNVTEEKLVHSNVFSVSIGNQSISNLTRPVKMYFQNSSKVNGNDTCKFWNFTKGID